MREPDRLNWLAPEIARDLAAADTNAFRLAGSGQSTVEMFGTACLISTPDAMPDGLESLLGQIHAHARACGIHPPSDVFHRTLAVGPGSEDAPVRVRGAGGASFEAREGGLAYGVDFAGGYSSGFFIDQRENRRRVRECRPSRALNCFAFTCSFSVAAAAVGAATVSVDLSKRSLARGRENFERNHLATTGHRFIADDVFDVLPRLARRGEKFDVIILDPPTFARGNGGRVFRAAEDFPRLIRLAVACAAPGARILVSTNCSRLTPAALARAVREAVPGAGIRPCPPPPDCAAGPAAVSAWVGAVES